MTRSEQLTVRCVSGFNSRRPDDSHEVGLWDNVDQIPSEHITVKLERDYFIMTHILHS